MAAGASEVKGSVLGWTERVVVDGTAAGWASDEFSATITTVSATATVTTAAIVLPPFPVSDRRRRSDTTASSTESALVSALGDRT